MGFFRRRRETLNEQLLREAGLDQQSLGQAVSEPDELQYDPQPPIDWGVLTGVPVGRDEFDACVTTRAPGLAGDRVEFTTIPNGDVIVSEETGNADVSPLADAVERHVSPPYRAVATRQDGDLWAVGAKQIEVAQIPFPDGEKLELSRNGEDEELRVDGKPSDAAVPPKLQRLGEAAGDNFFVEAERVDRDLWEFGITAL